MALTLTLTPAEQSLEAMRATVSKAKDNDFFELFVDSVGDELQKLQEILDTLTQRMIQLKRIFLR